MPNEIIQRKLFNKREAKILNTKIVYKTAIFGRESEVSISYEELSRDKESYFKTFPYINLIIGILFLFTVVSLIYRNDKDFNPDIWIFWSTLLTVAIIFYFLTTENLWKVRVQNNTYLFFLKSSPNKEFVNNFIDMLFSARDEYLKETYFFEPTKNISYESQINNLRWLRKVEVINRNEFNDRKKLLDEIFNLEVNKIGFN